MASRPSTNSTVGAGSARLSCGPSTCWSLTARNLRPLPFSKRKAKLARLLARGVPGLALNEHIEADGAAVFAEACRMGLEGIVSKRLDAPLSVRPLRGLDQGQEPGQPGGHARAGGPVLTAVQERRVTAKSR
jgi:hypothetical protein